MKKYKKVIERKRKVVIAQSFLFANVGEQLC